MATTVALVGLGQAVAAEPSVTAGAVHAASPAASPSRYGYITAAVDGSVAGFAVPAPPDVPIEFLAAPIVGMARDPATGGFWLVGADGGVFSYNAPFYGSLGGHRLNAPIVGIAYDAATGGYWLVGRDGGVFSFNARYWGSLGGQHLAAPVVGITGDPAVGGYWLVGSDGAVYPFRAHDYGSLAGDHLNAPIVGLTYDSDTGGYFLVGADGGVFSFGNPFHGSLAGHHLNAPIVSITADPATGGYWLAAADGGVFAFHAPYYGSAVIAPGLAPGLAVVTPTPPEPAAPLPPRVTAISAGLVLSPPASPSATGQAEQMLDAVVVPPGTRKVASLPGPAFSQPALSIGCTPLIDKSRFWVVPGNALATVTYLESREPAWMPGSPGEYGTYSVDGRIESYDVTLAPVGPGWNFSDQIVFTVAADGDDSTGIRADAQAVPRNGTCIYA